MQYPTIILISGKHPIEGKSGYARYSRALARQLTDLHLNVHIFCVGVKTSVTRTDIGTIHVVKIPLLALVSGREMAAVLPASILLARAINQQKNRTVLWGIGPWSLAGAWVKLRNPSIRSFADYFTSMKHEYSMSNSKYIVTLFYSPFERYLLAKSDRIITHYRSTETILTKEFGIHPKKFYRIPYAIT